MIALPAAPQPPNMLSQPRQSLQMPLQPRQSTEKLNPNLLWERKERLGRQLLRMERWLG